jgi:hypothetical protein
MSPTSAMPIVVDHWWVKSFVYVLLHWSQTMASPTSANYENQALETIDNEAFQQTKFSWLSIVFNAFSTWDARRLKQAGLKAWFMHPGRNSSAIYCILFGQTKHCTHQWPCTNNAGNPRFSYDQCEPRLAPSLSRMGISSLLWDQFWVQNWSHNKLDIPYQNPFERDLGQV